MDVPNTKLTSQYSFLLTPSEYAFANLLSVLQATIAAENCAIGCTLDGKLLNIVTT